MFKLFNRSKSTLVIVQSKNGKISSSTLNTLKAAELLKSPVTALLPTTGKHVDSLTSTLKKLPQITSIITSTSDAFANPLAENVAELVVGVQKKKSFTNILTCHSPLGKSVLPRVASQLDVSQVSDIIQVISEDTFVRPIYAGNAMATVKSSDNVKLITVRSTAFPAVEKQAEEGKASVEKFEAPAPNSMIKFVQEELVKSDRPELTSAKVVISGGRGLKNGENFKLLYDLADKFGAAVGASRAAVDAGYVPNDLQIGQTGKIVAPQLYIAVGISGAIQHLAGMKDSKVIVAINKDPEAPIFQVSDYGLVEDLFKAVPELTEKIKK